MLGVVGEFNNNLKELEKIVETNIYSRGNSILVKSDLVKIQQGIDEVGDLGQIPDTYYDTIDEAYNHKGESIIPENPGPGLMPLKHFSSSSFRKLSKRVGEVWPAHIGCLKADNKATGDITEHIISATN